MFREPVANSSSVTQSGGKCGLLYETRKNTVPSSSMHISCTESHSTALRPFDGFGTGLFLIALTLHSSRSSLKYFIRYKINLLACQCAIVVG